MQTDVRESGVQPSTEQRIASLVTHRGARISKEGGGFEVSPVFGLAAESVNLYAVKKHAEDASDSYRESGGYGGIIVIEAVAEAERGIQAKLVEAQRVNPHSMDLFMEAFDFMSNLTPGDQMNVGVRAIRTFDSLIADIASQIDQVIPQQVADDPLVAKK